MKTKIIFDTDPGIDDAMAIMFAEASDAIELVGVTTVYGNATIEHGTNNMLFLKQKYGMHCDVAMGAAKPLIRPPVGPTVVVHGESGFGHVTAPFIEPTALDSRPAYQYIIDQVKANPGEITLVAVGPLTNLALALQAEPQITEWVKEVVVMGGGFGTYQGYFGNVSPFAEANIHDDPDAADQVFTANWPVVIVGLDVTHQSVFSGQYLNELRDDAGEVGQFIWDISRYYLEFYSKLHGMDGCRVHDPSAVAYVIAPELFGLRQGPVRVICDGPAIGHTMQKITDKRHHHDEWSDMPVQQVAVTVDAPALLDLYKNTLVNYSNKLTN